MKKILCLFVYFGLGIFTTIFSSNQSPVIITSEPQTNVEVINEDSILIYKPTTPIIFNLKANDNFLDGTKYYVSFKKEGYKDKTKYIESSINIMYYWNFFNIRFWGIGLWLDILKGNFFALDKTISLS